MESVYDSSEHHLVKDLFSPLLKESRVYFRGVGYFTSGWLREAAEGLIPFAERGGRAFFITSPHLEEKDWEAFKLAERAKREELVYSSIQGSVANLAKTMREETATALAWLVADNILTFKFAVPKNGTGDYHDKVGVFEDEDGDRVAIHGSYNDSVHGLLNGESFSVFRSWLPGQQEYVDRHSAKLARLWNGENDFFDVYDLTDAVRDDIKRLRDDRPRPYSLPAVAASVPAIKTPIGVNLYPFQREGIESWTKAGGRGLFEMATGTGKTITSLAAATRLHTQLGALAVVVSAPFNHLVDQWAEEATRFGFAPMCCREDSSDWVPAVRSRVQDFNAGGRRSLFLITTHKTGADTHFRTIASRISGPSLLIADEVHYLGSPQYRKALLELYQYRIGLSATPDRWFDPVGTTYLRDYFGATVVDMPLEEAIGRFLTPYRFFPHPVRLTPAEMDEFGELSKKISKQIAMGRRDEAKTNRVLEAYLRQRANLVAKACNKLPTLQRLMQAKISEVGLEKVRHTIVYCAPGETRSVVRLLADMGLRVHEFVYRVPNDVRVQLLRQFESGDVQILVAIKCLDEGVNIPATREAYFLSSTSNPREFVQRRGRILRKAPGKTRAVLYDLVVVPPAQPVPSKDDLEMYRVLLRKEMPRFAEFAAAAENEFEARQVLFPLLRNLDLVHLLDLKPWDIYHQGTQWGDYGDPADS